MARNVTLLQLRTRVRRQTDRESSADITDALLTDWINASLGEFYEFLVESGLDYFETTASFTTFGGASFNLPSDYLGTKRVSWQQSAQILVPLRELMSNEVELFTTLTGASACAYRTVAGQLILFPTPPANQTYVHRYIPAPPVLAADGDLIDGVSGLEEMVVVDVCRKVREREQQDTAPLERELDRLRARALAAIQARAATTPRHITDDEEMPLYYYGRLGLFRNN